MKQKIGIIAAADDEIQPLIAQMRIEKTEEAAMLKLIEGTWQGQSITAVRCGVGKVNAALATQLLIDKQVSVVIMIGTAGALDPNLRIGDVIIIERCTYHDVDHLGVLIHYHPYMKDLWFLSDPDLVHLAERAAGQGNGEGKIRTGRSVSGDQFIDQAGRSSIIEKFNPDCVDMESAAVAHVCYVNQIPFLALRAISDTPHQSGSKAYHQNSSWAALQALTLLERMMSELGENRLE